MRFRVKRFLQGGKELLGGSREKARNKARGVISSSRRGSRVIYCFLCGTRNRPLEHEGLFSRAFDL